MAHLREISTAPPVVLHREPAVDAAGDVWYPTIDPRGHPMRSRGARQGCARTDSEPAVGISTNYPELHPGLHGCFGFPNPTRFSPTQPCLSIGP